MSLPSTIRTRRANLKRLIRERFADSQSNFSEVTGIKLSQLGQWLASENSPHLRNMSERSARKIETICALPALWLDRDHEKDPDRTDVDGEQTGFTLLDKHTDIVTISRYETGGSMGDGVVLHDQPGIIESWRVSKQWLAENVRGYTSAANLAIVTGFGDSMRPTYNPGDPLIVDRGITTVPYDSIYFFRIGEEGFVKRLQRVPTENGLIYQAISDNPAYPSFPITPGMDFAVLARVVQVWRREDY